MSEKLSIEQIEKVGNTVIYLSTRVGELARTKLLKILFLLEEKSIKEFGKPFFGLDFKVWQFGPVVEPVYKEITDQVDVFKDYFKKNRFDEFEAVKPFNDDEFSNNDIKLLDEMVNFARHKIATDFVRITHAPGSLWTETAKKHGVYEALEYGSLTTTDFSIDFSMLFKNDPDSFIAEKYYGSLENNIFSKNFKELKAQQVFDTGNILYCKNFQFNNGNQPKEKYFIVLKRDGNNLIVGSLPTRTNKVPSFIDTEHGCVNKDDRCFNCYLFQAKKPICDNGFFFELPTFVYGDEIEFYNTEIVEANYKLNETYKVEGRLTNEEFSALIGCFTNSDSVKNKIKKVIK